MDAKKLVLAQTKRWFGDRNKQLWGGKYHFLNSLSDFSLGKG